jgi:hypothetical protein
VLLIFRAAATTKTVADGFFLLPRGVREQLVPESFVHPFIKHILGSSGQPSRLQGLVGDLAPWLWELREPEGCIQTPGPVYVLCDLRQVALPL